MHTHTPLPVPARSSRQPLRWFAVLSAVAVVAGLGVTATGNTAEAATVPAADQSLRLWYDEPASAGFRYPESGGGTAENDLWQQRTLPIGNGYLGANVYGEIGHERLSFNEKTLWTGGPSTSRPNYIGGNLPDRGRDGAALREVQNLFASGDAAAAQSAAQQNLVGGSDGYGAYEGYAEIGIDYGFDDSGATGYERALDLKTGIASVQFDRAGVHYTREMFASYPGNVLVTKLTASDAGALNLDIDFAFRHSGAVTTAQGDTLTVSGALADNQLQHNAVIRAVPTGGSVSADGDHLRITGASEVVLYVSASTDYENTYPAYRTGQTAAELAAEVAERVDAAVSNGFDAVRAAHLADYQELFNRVTLEVGASAVTDATDDLVDAYRRGTASDAQKNTAQVLLYQYGRYLAISSSREGSLPSNLQGVWADRYTGGPSSVPWGSDYHMNVNLQMNYWPAYSGNLAETAIPLVGYVDSLREPGRVTAAIYGGVVSTPENPENGFTAHTQNTPFGWTTPGWNFSWGWSPAAVPWILQNVYEYYEFTGDEDYLRSTIYPMMREAARYFDQTLVEDPTTGRLVSSPAYSPEHGPITAGNYYEEQLIWQLYHDVIEAATTLDLDPELVASWKTNIAKLDPVAIGESGQIKEWYQETTLGSVPGADLRHRHLSHLLGLFPGDLISTETPELLAAARVSLDSRGDAATGWGIAQRLNAWARIGDGDRSLKIIDQLFRTGIYPNLFDTHPPFQIDGNFGYTSGVNEMLVQSNAGPIVLLPALPSAWQQGSVDGILARGNFEMGIDWAGGSAIAATVTSHAGGEFVGQYPGLAEARVTDAAGNVVSTTALSPDRISFATTAGETYTVTSIPAKPSTGVPTAGLVDDRDAAVRYTGGWASWDDPKHYNNTIQYINATTGGESIELTFSGTGVVFVAPKYSSFTSLDFFIDGTKVNAEPVSWAADSYQPKQEYVVADGLSAGEHTVRVVVTGAPSPGGGTKIEFDAFRVTG